MPLPLNTMVVIAAAEQIVCDDGDADAAAGIELTTTVAEMGVPVQPLAVGVMVNVTVTGEPLVLVNVPDIFPEPLDAMPVTEPVLFLVQLKVAALTLLLNTIGVMAPEQILCDDGVAVATGTGFTSTFALLAQLFVVGVMVNVTYKGAALVLVNDPLILPEPLFAIPVTEAVLFLVQL